MEKDHKTSKITYKIYYNKRLKQTRFHTKVMYPLYVQVIFDRIPIIFKSYYFDLFSKSRYAIRVASDVFSPNVDEIIKKEEALIEFIIEKNKGDFSLELFKKEYAFYSRDLLDLMEEGFLHYLYTFLHDEGFPHLADTINKGASDCKAFDIARDMKRVFNEKTYKKLAQNAFYYAPPYLPLYAFSETPKATPLRSFSVMDWERPGVKEQFIAYFKKYYPEQDVERAVNSLKKLVGTK